jgi:hypothetical protein
MQRGSLLPEGYGFSKKINCLDNASGNYYYAKSESNE